HDRATDDAAAEALQRLGRQRRDAARGERQRRPLVGAAGRERREDLSAEPARAHAGARKPEAVGNTSRARPRTSPQGGEGERRGGRGGWGGRGGRRGGRGSGGRAVARSPENRSSSLPRKPIGPEPLPISTRPSFVGRK